MRRCNKGLPRERLYVLRVVTHPVVGVTIIVVEPPGGTAVRSLHAMALNPKGHANRKAMEGFNACLAKHVTIDSGENIVPMSSEMSVEFIRARRVKLPKGGYIGMHARGPDDDDERAGWGGARASMSSKKASGITSRFLVGRYRLNHIKTRVERLDPALETEIC